MPEKVKKTLTFPAFYGIIEVSWKGYKFRSILLQGR